MQHVLLAALMALGPATALDQQRPVRELVAGLTADDAVVRARAACELKEHGDGAADAVDGLVRLMGDATLGRAFRVPRTMVRLWRAARPRPATWPPQRWSPSAAERCRR